MCPIIPLACLAGLLTSIGGMLWYDSLSRSEKEEADEIASGYAWELFEKSLNQLTAEQARHVNRLTRQHFN